MNLIFNLIINSISIFIVSNILAGVRIDSFWAAIGVAIVLAFVNVLLKPILLVLTLPINFLTLGLFTLFINAFLVLLTSYLVTGFHVDGILWAALFSLLVSFVSSFLQVVL